MRNRGTGGCGALPGPSRHSAFRIPHSAPLTVRNRIYARVFNREWITQHMPNAELRRQRAAYRRGLLRASAVAGVVLAIVTSLAGAALQQRARARAAEAI